MAPTLLSVPPAQLCTYEVQDNTGPCERSQPRGQGSALPGRGTCLYPTAGICSGSACTEQDLPCEPRETQGGSAVPAGHGSWVAPDGTQASEEPTSNTEVLHSKGRIRAGAFRLPLGAPSLGRGGVLTMTNLPFSHQMQ